MPKPKECPKCKSDKVMRIQYGLFLRDHKYPEDVYLGGCVYDDYKWHCGSCDWEWGYNCEGRYNKPEEEK